MFKHFTLDKFACRCCGKSQMNLDFVAKLDQAREISKVIYRITSGYRCPKHNEEIGGSDNHPSGHAADIECGEGWKRIRILEGLIKIGFERIGIAKTFIHVDDMPKAKSCWLY